MFAGPGRLDHLVVSAIAFVEVAIAEIDGGIEHDQGFLIGEENLVAAVRGYEAGLIWRKGLKRHKGPKRNYRSSVATKLLVLVLLVTLVPFPLPSQVHLYYTLGIMARSFHLEAELFAHVLHVMVFQ